MLNIEIVTANNVLSEMIDVPLKGKLKFKIFKNKQKLETATSVIFKSLEGIEEEQERKDILDETQNIDIDLFTEDELESIDLTIKQMAGLRSIILFDEDRHIVEEDE